VRVHERARAHREPDFVLLEQITDAADQLLDDLVLAGHQLREIVADVLSLQPKIRGVLQGVQRVHAADHRFGRNAAPVQTGAAGIIVFDHDHARAQLRGANRGR
jgi:hypothetical protein